MASNKFIFALKKKKSKYNNKKEPGVIDKIQHKKRLSSQEFLNVYSSLWKEGPAVQYQNPDSRVRDYQKINDEQNP
jgi:hypothetical protein